MATLNFLKHSLRQKAEAIAPQSKQTLSDTEYAAGFQVFQEGLGQTVYTDFVVPQLSQLLEELLSLKTSISILEVGPGPRSVLGSLSGRLRRGIHRYVAFEPNDSFAAILERWLEYGTGNGIPFPCLYSQPKILREAFLPGKTTYVGTGSGETPEKFDLILFCHSMYGITEKRCLVERALDLLPEQPGEHVGGEMIIIFHRDGTLQLGDLICHRTACYPNGLIGVEDDDEALDRFAPFIAGFAPQYTSADLIKAEWRTLCRSLGRHDKDKPIKLNFGAPDVMLAFTRQATALPKLTAQVPALTKARHIKNAKARLNHPASTVRPTDVQHIQQCVRWALTHRLSLTVIGGSHSGQCVWPNVVAIDMSAFDKIRVVPTREDLPIEHSANEPLVVVEAGCKVGDVVQQAIAAGLTVPMGSRPSVGAGLWLQGGIGHLARSHGLTSDAIVGAVLVSVADAKVYCIGYVPSEDQPANAVHLEKEVDLLWAIRGGGTNFGIIVSLTFKAYPAPNYEVTNMVDELGGLQEARTRFHSFEGSAKGLPRNKSLDAYLYSEGGKLTFGTTLYELTTKRPIVPRSEGLTPHQRNKPGVVDCVGLFETEMYMSGMHGGHGSGKTSAFKRCLFLKNIGRTEIVDALIAAIESRPSQWCYIHLLHGGGAVSDLATNETAFGCRDWDYACVVTGVWSRCDDDTDIARDVVQWVYDLVMDLLPISSGAYGADLGPDPRDIPLAAVAFGPNLPRLGHTKLSLDPGNVLRYACPIAHPKTRQKLIVIVTGNHGVGKDYCANVWVSIAAGRDPTGLCAQAVSISTATKRQYAAAFGADPERLESDRSYKEQHRPALSRYFADEVRQRPDLPQEQFLDVVRGAGEFNVLFITGMRDKAPVAAMSHLIPCTKLIEVRVQARNLMRSNVENGCEEGEYKDSLEEERHSDDDNPPTLVFSNDEKGSAKAASFCKRHLFPFMGRDLQDLADMARTVPNFPRHGIDFRDVLGICQQPGGLTLCTTLLEAQLRGECPRMDVVVCCETGGYVYASALAARIDKPMALIRAAGRLPPPTISVDKPASYISSSTAIGPVESKIEMGRDLIPNDASVVVVDDVLASGNTLCAVLQLLGAAGVDPGNVSVLVVAEFPFHRGREALRRRGFARVKVQSLLVLAGA